jgi:hypothetical protein
MEELENLDQNKNSCGGEPMPTSIPPSSGPGDWECDTSLHPNKWVYVEDLGKHIRKTYLK